MLLHAFRCAGGSRAARRSVVPRSHDDKQQLYAVLGVSTSASQQEIKSAYKRLVHSLHPDKHQQTQVDTTEAFLRCKAAYEVLSNEQSRDEYDQQLDPATNTWQATQQQQWNPYNTTAAGSSKTRSSCSEQREPDPATAAAAAAAAANSSGLSACALRQRHGSMQLMRGVPGSAAAAATSDSQAEPAAALRAVLLSQYEVALEQFGSLQEALEYLEQQDQQDNLVGLAAEDYNTGHKQRKQHIRRHRQDGMYPGMYSPRAAR